MANNLSSKQYVINGAPSPTTPVTSVTIPVGGNPSANGAMTINARQSGNFLFGLSASVVNQMPCFSSGGGNIPWATVSPNVGRFAGATSQIVDDTAEFIAAAFGKTLNTAFSTPNAEIHFAGLPNSVTGSDVTVVATAIGSIPKPINQFGSLPTEPFALDGMITNNASHDSLVAFDAVLSGSGSNGIGFAKKTGNVYTEFFFSPNNPISVACGVNNLTDATLLLLASALGITPTSAVFAANTGGTQALQGSPGTWNSTGPAAATPYILVSLTV